MVFNLIGMGMDRDSISFGAIETLRSCDKVYLENYTVNFPYPISEIERCYGVEVIELDRAKVEDESIVAEAKDANVALLVYGDGLSATTHMQLILECKKQGVDYEVFPNASIFTAVAGTGLSLYKFGKTASMPNWKEHTNKPTSFIDYVKGNLSIGAHTLILTDIGLEIKDAIAQFKEAAVKAEFVPPEKVVAISNAGTEDEAVYYDCLDGLAESDIEMPFCLIVPGELHFLEEEVVESLKE